MSNPSQSYSIVDGVYTQEIDGEIIILDSNGETYFSLNEIGAKIWQLLLESKCQQDILDTLEGEYVVEEDRLRCDLDNLVDKLLSLHLIYDQRTKIEK